jgi:VIT1/CCC1 family predicted Fe2+/Mn2+ transporter
MPLSTLFELFGRGRLRRLGQSIRAAPNSADAESLVAGELDEMLGEVTSESDRRSLYKRVADNLRSRPPAPNLVTKSDLMGAFWSFWLVFLASLPAAIPFVIFDDARLALRVSNAILLALLFISGYLWARYTLSRPCCRPLLSHCRNSPGVGGYCARRMSYAASAATRMSWP